MARRYNARWTKSLDVGVRRTKAEALQFLKAHGWALMQELQHNTPKKTGALAAAWTSSVNDPSPEIPTLRETGSVYYAKMSKLRFVDAIKITNNQPYARRIEHGWGKNNPATGFVGPSLIAYKRRLKKK